MMREMTDVFLKLIRLGIGTEHIYNLSKEINWAEVEIMAERHGLSAVMVDGIERLPENRRPPQELLLQWIGETLHGYEYRYEHYCEAIAELAEWYNSHGYNMMILKGLACGADWPKPEHRPCGDIDIWLFGKQKEADSAFSKGKNIKIDKSHHHHTIFEWKGFLVENHYDFINVYHHKSNIEIDEVFKELAMDNTHQIDVKGERVFISSPNFQALFLLRHTMNHFASSEITLRQMLDWGFFVKAHGKDVDWEWLLNELERFGMKKLFDVFNAICVENLAFEVSVFPRVQFEPMLKDRVFNEILSPEFEEVEPKGLLKRVIFKYRRWKANEWKHELCYKDSMGSAFWSGIRSHVLKPSSI